MKKEHTFKPTQPKDKAVQPAKFKKLANEKSVASKRPILFKKKGGEGTLIQSNVF